MARASGNDYRDDFEIELEIDLDDHSDDITSFEFKKGDKFILCVEDTAIKFNKERGNKAPYADVQFAIVAGPLNASDNRDAGPRKDNSGVVRARRLWRNFSFAPTAVPFLKSFLRSMGHTGKPNLPKVSVSGEAGKAFAQAWDDLILDREIVATITIRNNKRYGASPELDKFEPCSDADMRIVKAVYDNMGSARDGRWIPGGDDNDPEAVKF